VQVKNKFFVLLHSLSDATIKQNIITDISEQPVAYTGKSTTFSAVVVK
jgi:hypothetical protein